MASKEELKQKCTERAKIFQQAMESCHSSSPMDCIEWFADRIAELEKEIEELKKTYRKQRNKRIDDLQKKNAELKKQLEMSNKVYNDNLDYSHHIEGQLTNAKELLAKWVELFKPKVGNIPPTPIQVETEQFLKDTTETEQEEPYYVIMNMNCQYEICRKCPKSGLFKGTYEECKNWIKEKLSEVEK